MNRGIVISSIGRSRELTVKISVAMDTRGMNEGVLYEQLPVEITVDESRIGVVEFDKGGVDSIHRSWLRRKRRWIGYMQKYK